jgi:microcystin-dependent protein
MANIKFTNFARTALAVGVGSGDVTMSVTGGTGALFPALTAGQYFYAVLENAALDREIVKVTARATDTFTVTRGQDGTTARSWVAGDSVSLRFVAAAISDAVVGTLLAANNLSDVGSAATARANLGALTAGDNIGAATATTQSPGDNSTKVATTAFVSTAIAANPGVPSGTVIHVAMSTAPTGYLKANGALVSRTTYAALFSVIGTVFGVGDGSTTFSLPDLRGEFARGWDDGRGVDSGRGIGTAQAEAVQNHSHTFSGYGGGGGANIAAGSVFGYGTVSTGATTGNGPETRPRNIALLACIKY